MSLFLGPSAPPVVTGRLRVVFLALSGLALFALAWPVHAATTVSVTPITWAVIGLDSNRVDVGPNRFPVGARVCNTGAAAAANVQATFVWDTANPLIGLRPGTLGALSVPSLAIGACTDFYFEVEVIRDAAAYGTTRRYRINVAADAGATTGSTPVPREVFVERLISQSRNAVTDVRLSSDGGATFQSIAAGGTMTLLVGKTYDIRVVATTATNGYEQLETFINIPNTTFQVLNVATTYTADTSPTVNPPYDRLYGDACVWQANPLSPNYRSCNATGKVGGDITVTYRVRILSVPGPPLTNPEPLETLVYDFSGSSFHYNSDFGVSARYAYILDPSTVTLTKGFVPSTTTPGGTSTLTLRIPNTTSGTLSGVNFLDPLPTSPAAMVVAPTPNATSSGCGSPTWAPTAGAATLAFSGGTIAPNSTCVLTVSVTAPTVGNYTNTTGNLFLEGTTPGTGTDTGNSASAVLTVSTSGVSCVSGQTLARWTVPLTATNPPDTAGGAASVRASNVATATAAASQPANTAIVAGATTNAWSTYGYKTAPTQSLTFVVDTRNYSNVSMTWNWTNPSPNNGPTGGTVVSSLGGSFPIVPPATAGWVAGPTVSGLLTSTTGNTTFTLNMTGAKNDNSGASVHFDDITFTGCSYTPPPNISKTFVTNPIVVGGTPSRLDFTVRNNTVTTPVYSPVALQDVQFTDVLPTGLRLVNNGSFPASTTCASTSGAALALTAVNGTTSISLTGAELAAGASCTVSVYVEGTLAGSYLNVSGFVSGFNGGVLFTNTGSNGYATAPITVLAPPAIAKAFGDETILTGDTTSLSFTVTNPNAATALTGVNFTDTLPGGLVVATPNGLVGSCGGGTVTAAAGSGSVSLSGATLAAQGSCTFSVDVLGTTVGTKLNTVTVSATQTGNGNTATADLVVKTVTPAISLLKQVGPTASGVWTSFLARSVGADVYYQLSLENVGDVDLTSISVTDPLVSLVGCAWPAFLAVGDVATCVVGPVSAVAGSHPNTATASGSYLGTTVTDTSTATYSTNGLTLVKANLQSSFAAAGETLDYSYGVTNTGAVALAGPVTVADDKTTVVCPAVDTVGNLDGNLDPDETIVCTASYVTTAGDISGGQVTNLATASAAAVSSNTDSATVPSTAGIDLAVTKTDGVGVIETGSSVTYTITVENHGPSVDGATLSDPAVTGLTKTSIGACTAFGGATCPVVGAGAGNLNITNLENGTATLPSLPVGSSLVFTVTCQVTATSGPVINTVTVTKTNGGLIEFVASNDSASDSDELAENFGHLPSSYAGMNLLADGGARALSGTTYLGASKTTASDGINTASYTPKASDDGVSVTPAVAWSYASGGSVDVVVSCPGGTCYLNAWIDWNADGDFDDAGEKLFADNLAVVAGTNTLTFPIPGGALLDGTTLYSRFRLSAAPMTSPSPAGQAVGGGVPLVGEIEDPVFSAQDGTVPTPVTLASFRASREGGRIHFDWSTASETGNVGFNLYAVRGQGLAKVNRKMIPSRRIDSLELTRYSYQTPVDWDGGEGDAFFIEDVSVTNERRMHGPFDADRTYGGRTKDEKIAWDLVRTEQSAARSERIERAKAAHRQGLAKAGATSVALLGVTATGIQRVSREALLAAGLDVPHRLAPNLLLTQGGQPVPIFVPAGGGGPDPYFEFLGQALDTLYTGTNVYRLEIGGRGGPGIQEVGGPPAGSAAPRTYAVTRVFERQTNYANYAPSEDPWYDTGMLAYTKPKTWLFPFELDGFDDPMASASLRLVVWGVTDWPHGPDHHLVASVNGVPVADELFDGLVEKVWDVEVPRGTLRAGTNELRLTLPGDAGGDFDLVNFDRLEVTYQRRFEARAGRLKFDSSASSLRVAQLSEPDVVVYRQDRQGLRRLKSVAVEPAGNGFAAAFSGSQGATYHVSSVGSLHRPAVRLLGEPGGLEEAADTLVIAHPQFIPHLDPLREMRSRQGLSVSVVDVEAIYASYSDGVLDPTAIWEYIAHAYEDLGVRSVLLVGGDTYDYRNYLGIGSVSFVPSLYAATGSLIRFAPSDALYADVDLDGSPELPIGRLPVRTVAELEMVLSKMEAYADKDYERTAVFASDKRDRGTSFKNYNESFIASLPPGWSVERIALDDLPVQTARNRLLAAMNRGTALVTYTGHSGPREWTFSGLFASQHAANLTNAGRPFVVVQWGCWNSYFVDPVNEYLVQKFLFSGDPSTGGVGAAAVLGASTLTESSSELLLGRLLTPLLAQPGMSLGQALQDAKAELALTHPELADVLLGWNLLGDPELVVQP